MFMGNTAMVVMEEDGAETYMTRWKPVQNASMDMVGMVADGEETLKD
jgi:hypothetical protein